MKFLTQITDELLARQSDLSAFTLVLPGKRPVVFIKEILAEKKYSGFLPDFFTIEELLRELAGAQPLQGVALWLKAFEVYRETDPDEDFSRFLKWFPTVQKDWDDMMKFAPSDKEVLEQMFAEERIKNWAEGLGPDTPRGKYLTFWRKMNVFLPKLKARLHAENSATAGMIHEMARNKIDEFSLATDRNFVFCGFNAFTPVEEKLVRSLMQWDKAQCFFQADHYYMDDERQEAGKFLRSHQLWKEFNDSRQFRWIYDDFSAHKNIKVYEVSGNITQTKVLPDIFNDIPKDEWSETAVVLLDENLLPACLDALQVVDNLNITMGFPLRNLSFSNAIKKLFYLQKQLEKKDSAYYYSDVLNILEEMPATETDRQLTDQFKAKIEERNIIYVAKRQLHEWLGGLTYFSVLQKASRSTDFLRDLISFCAELKFREIEDILYENISHFENTFKTILTQIEPYGFTIKMETLEVLVNQIIQSESIDLKGEPLRGVQVMGLLETRLLNFRNVILLSANEGKLPLGNSQNTYIPFDVRQHFNLHTFLENDSIYAYHFYRLLQRSENVHLLFNALSSGVNTGEKSRFITQLEVEDRHHEIEHIIIENSSGPAEEQLFQVQKTPAVLQKLEQWKNRVSASHLNTYLYNPADFYLSKILNIREAAEVEEELSQRNYGNLVHYALQIIYTKLIGKVLTEKDLSLSSQQVNEALDAAIEELKHQPEYYERGLNYVYRSIAERVVTSVLAHDRGLVEAGHTLEILSVEEKFEQVEFSLADGENKVYFLGYIDRIDRLDGQVRIIDYKTGRTKDLSIKTPKKPEEEEKLDQLFFDVEKNQAMQLCIYAYSILNKNLYAAKTVQCGIWSFAQVNRGVQHLQVFGDENISAELLERPMAAVGNVILEILDPAVDFTEKIRPVFAT